VTTVQRNVQEGDPDPLVNTAEVSCSPAGFPNVLTASDSWSVDLFQASFTIAKTGDDLSKVGDDVNYTITLENTSSGDAPNLECTIVDPLLGLNKSVTLASGNSDVTNATRTVLSGDPDPLVNEVTATCSPVGFPNTSTKTASHSTNLFQPSILFTKTGDPLSKVGDDVNYTITLENTSSPDTPDLVCTITDALLTIDDTETLASGGSYTITPVYTVQPGDPDPLVNTANVSCSVTGFPNILTATASHSVNLFQPDFELYKTADPLSKVGDPVNYTITLDNTSSGDSPPLVCTITDLLLLIDQTVTVAAADPDYVINATRTVQSGDPDPLTNTASATCVVADFGNVLGPKTASATTNLFQPDVEVIKTGPLTAIVGETITYHYRINNLSSSDAPNLILDNVLDDVVGTLTGAATTAGCGVLASGEFCEFDATYTIQMTDPDPLVNIVTVHYHPLDFPNDVWDDDTWTVDWELPPDETAWAANGRVAGDIPFLGSNWATYLQYYSGKPCVDLYAGQTDDAGDVCFSEIGGNIVQITITLQNGYTFWLDGLVDVMAERYHPKSPTELGISNPPPGQFGYQGVATLATTHTFTLRKANYFAIHALVVPSY
jgi:hypothetical protein